MAPGGWPGPASSGPLRTDAGAGRYSYSSAFPDQRASTDYLADIRFTPEFGEIVGEVSHALREAHS